MSGVFKNFKPLGVYTDFVELDKRTTALPATLFLSHSTSSLWIYQKQNESTKTRILLLSEKPRLYGSVSGVP
jgi:hypothetical protein